MTGRQRDDVPDVELDAWAHRYTMSVFAEILEVPVPELEELDSWDVLGLSSLQNMNIVARLDQDLGEVPVTLLFEHPSPAQTAYYLLENKRDELRAAMSGWRAERETSTPSGR
ncbi:acyl carrier protein [Streptomyces pathocidini]|uniref:Acyl carrier protein n=1 Tax=Streptomyces pathocidini TaxID=1650571 RepID=A0ABW7UJ20_9ACTN|nr:acyl carrier protein [Streptomyces pathocidini]